MTPLSHFLLGANAKIRAMSFPCEVECVRIRNLIHWQLRKQRHFSRQWYWFYFAKNFNQSVIIAISASFTYFRLYIFLDLILVFRIGFAAIRNVIFVDTHKNFSNSTLTYILKDYVTICCIKRSASI